MYIPKLFYGTTTDVKRECRKLTTKIVKGALISEVFNRLELIDTRNNNGLIVINGPSPLVGGEAHFHVYVWLRELNDSYYKINTEPPKDLIESGIEYCMKSPWAFLAFLTTQDIRWYKERRSQMWPAIVRFYPVYELEGKRFSSGSNIPTEIWNFWVKFYDHLVKMGVPEKEFLPPPGSYAPYTPPPFWQLVKKYGLPTDFPPYVSPKKGSGSTDS